MGILIHKNTKVLLLLRILIVIIYVHMNKLAKYIIVSVVCAFILFLAWYFSSILTNILIAAVLSLIGKPLMERLMSVKIGKYKLGSSLSAVITLMVLGSIIVGFFIFITPLLGKIAKDIGSINFDELRVQLETPLLEYNVLLHELFPALDPEVTIESIITEQIKDILSFGLVSHTFSSITGFLINFAISAFVIVFVTFFFLKDRNMFSNMILIFVPVKYEENTKRALDSINTLIVRYFTGISVEAILITILNTLGLYFIGGLSFQLSVVLAFLSGVLNVIPYIGPWCAGALGTLMGVLSLYGTVDISFELLVIELVTIFAVTHLIDVFIFQPYIYSNSVKAHPLEIFIVILLAGNIGGIVGMLVAIPAYTVLRVFAKEFFSNFKLVQRLTDRME